jgi:hypothetical protein
MDASWDRLCAPLQSRIAKLQLGELPVPNDPLEMPHKTPKPKFPKSSPFDFLDLDADEVGRQILMVRLLCPLTFIILL